MTATGSRRRVHHVAEAVDRDRRLLEALPQPGEAQHRLREAGGEHLERDQHADREAVALHDEQRADHQDRDRHRLLERGGERVVAVGGVAGGEGRREVAAEDVAVAALELRLHLQRLHRLRAGDVLGEEGLAARAGEELPVEALRAGAASPARSAR